MPERLSEFNRLELQRKLEDAQQLELLIADLQNLISNTFPNKSTLCLNSDHIEAVLRWASNRINSLKDLVDKDLAFLWVMPESEYKASDEEILTIKKLSYGLNGIEFDKETLGVFLRKFAKETNFPFSKLMRLLRAVLSGLKVIYFIYKLVKTILSIHLY